MRRVFGDAITDLVLEVTDVSRPSDGKRAVREEKVALKQHVVLRRHRNPQGAGI
jgi:hypothetical protein